MADQLPVGRAVVHGRVLLAQDRPPVSLLPCLEPTGVLRGQAVAGHAPGIHDDQRQLRLPDEVRPDVHVAEEVRIAEQRAAVPAGVTGQQAYAVGARKVVRAGGADSGHLVQASLSGRCRRR
jgi:hypothetical protein